MFIDIFNTEKKYKIIYADPPWNYVNKSTRAAASKHYGTMNLNEIKALPVENLAFNDSVLFLWVTFPMLKEGLDTIEAWGFKYKTLGFNWVKENKKSGGLFWGLGNWTRSNSEICLLGVRGSPKRINAGVHSVIISRVQEHSQKPAEVRERIENLMGQIPRIELFARETAQGWDCWGNEVDYRMS